MRILKVGALVLAGWTLYAMFSATQIVARMSAAPDWKFAFEYSLIDSYLWAILTPAVFAAAGALATRRPSLWRSVPLLFAAGFVFALVHVWAMVHLLPMIGYRSGPKVARAVFLNRFHVDLLTCWILFGIGHGVEYYRRYRVRELRASQLEAKLALAQLQVLQMQLQPHFLFNTLHAISALMYRDVERADRMISRLSDFLRLTLNSIGMQEVTLKSEMEFLDKYLEIEQERFGDRLEVRRAIEPEALDLLVPNLVLQPLVENAVRHGIAPQAAGGRIEIGAWRRGPVLAIEVTDDGTGCPGEIREGGGISMTRARLERLYGDEFRLDIGNAADRGFRVSITIPGHMEERGESSDR